MTESHGTISSTAQKLVGDVYERKARLYPALVLLTPLAIVAGVFLSFDFGVIKSLIAAIATMGGAFFLAQLARDAGKQGERKLFAIWGGMPSVSILRHRDTRVDSITKARIHAELAKLVTGSKSVTPNEEKLDPAAADITYEAWSHYLRTHTRDTKKFPLIFSELVNYGYRRNLWGLRYMGIAVSTLCVLICAAYLLYGFYHFHPATVRAISALFFSIVFVFFWTLRASESWVRVAADAYAQRLIEAADDIEGKKPASRPQAKTKKVSK